jgi:hypothetical protein
MFTDKFTVRKVRAPGAGSQSVACEWPGAKLAAAGRGSLAQPISNGRTEIRFFPALNSPLNSSLTRPAG